jgi:hypothetical protein
MTIVTRTLVVGTFLKKRAKKQCTYKEKDCHMLKKLGRRTLA